METILANTEEKQLILNKAARYHLGKARNWTMFLSILVLIFMGISLFGTIIMMIALPTLPPNIAQSQMGSPLVSGFISLLNTFIMGYFIFSLYQFSKYSKIAIETMNSEALALAFKYLQTHYTIAGVLVIIFLVIFAVFALFMIPVLLAGLASMGV
jgi:uncharacterized protein YqhQ